MRKIKIHPDGRRIAFTAGKPVHQEVCVLENLLPALKDGSYLDRSLSKKNTLKT